ncbi:MAG: FecR domain-containing protein [Candidatus Sumerlaeia bacterium]|nr:FecR domain-containing protein [Candidatus Sumerlaeia bacterium]
MEDRILAQLDGMLSPEEERSLFAEIEADPERRKLYDSYREQEVALEAYFAGKAKRLDAIAPPDLSREAPAARAAVVPVGNPRNRQALRFLAAAAAVALMATGGAVVWNRMDKNPYGQVLASSGHAQMVLGGGGGMASLRAEDTVTREARRLKTTGRSSLSVELARGAGTLDLESDTAVSLSRAARATSLELERGSVFYAAGDEPAVLRTPELEVRARGGRVSVVRGIRGSEVAVLDGEAEVFSQGTRKTLRAGQAFSSIGAEPVPVAWPAQREPMEVAAAPARATSAATPTAEPAEQAPAYSTATTGPIGSPALATTSWYMPGGTELLIEIPSISALLGPHGLSSPADLLDVQAIVDALDTAGVDPEVRAEFDEVRAEVEQVLADPDLRTVAGAMTGSLSIGLTKDGPVAAVGLQGSNALAAEQVVRERFLPMLGTASLLPNGPRLTAQRGVAMAGVGGAAWSEALAALSSGTVTSFTRSRFHDEVRSMTPGSGFTVAVDFASALERSHPEGTPERRKLDLLGFGNLRTLIASNSFGDQARNQAMRLTFDGERAGVMGWLREPGAMGGLRYFSPDAHVIGAMKIERPVNMLHQMYAFAASERPGMPDPRGDEVTAALERIAATLGGEVAFGLDNPVAPLPNAKLAFEVVDPAGFHEGMVGLFELVWARDGGSVEVATDTHRGHLIVEAKLSGVPFAISYALIEDFVVFAPGRNFTRATIDLVEDNRSIDREYAFTQALPASSGSHASALLYVKTAGMEAIGQTLAALGQGAQQEGDGGEGFQLDLAALSQVDLDTTKGDAAVMYAVARPDSIDVFIDGVKVGDYRMAGVLPAVYDMVTQP